MPKDDRFSCDNLKGTATAGAEIIVTFTYKPPEVDPLIVFDLLTSGEDGYPFWRGSVEGRQGRA